AVNGAFLVKPVTGVQRYAAEMLRAMHRASAGEFVVLAPGSAGIDEFAGFPVLRDTWTRRTRMRIWEQVYLPRLYRRSGAHGMWNPCNSGPYLVTPQVVTIHDASPYDHPEWFSRTFASWYRVLLPALARRANVVITDSEFSRRRIAEWTNRKSEEIVVVYPGVGFGVPAASAAAAKQRCAELGLPPLFVLFA